MYGPALHIAIALLTFTVGLLTANPFERLHKALPLALAVFLVLKKITALNLTLHHVQVALLTLFLWVLIASGIVALLIGPRRSCVLEFVDVEDQVAVTAE